MNLQEKKYFAAKLISRPTFMMDMTPAERTIMEDHKNFWNELFEKRVAIVTGPELDPAGAYGFGIITAQSLEEAEAILKDDPAQQIASYEIHPMLAIFPTV